MQCSVSFSHQHVYRGGTDNDNFEYEKGTENQQYCNESRQKHHFNVLQKNLGENALLTKCSSAFNLMKAIIQMGAFLQQDSNEKCHPRWLGR